MLKKFGWVTVLMVLAIASVVFYIQRTGERPPENCLDWNQEDFHKTAPADVLAECLAAGANPNTMVGGTPVLSLAVFYKPDPNLVQLFLDRGADPDREDPFGRTALHWAMFAEGDVRVLDSLIGAGANVNHADEDGVTPLMQGLLRDPGVALKAELVERLVQAGADMEKRDAQNRTPLHIAVDYRAPATTFRALLDQGARIDAENGDGLVPLESLLCNEPEPEEVQTLLSGGADAARRDSWGGTPLHKAIRCRVSTEVVELLLQAGAPVNARNDDGEIPFHNFWLYEGFGQSELKTIALMIDAGADLNATAEDGDTPLIMAVFYGEFRQGIVDMLLNEGADVTAVGDYERTSLHYLVISTDDLALLARFVDAGADVNARDADGETPLHWAAREGTSQVAMALIQAGADPSLRNNEGQTPNDLKPESH